MFSFSNNNGQEENVVDPKRIGPSTACEHEDLGCHGGTGKLWTLMQEWRSQLGGRQHQLFLINSPQRHCSLMSILTEGRAGEMTHRGPNAEGTWCLLLTTLSLIIVLSLPPPPLPATSPWSTPTPQPSPAVCCRK